MKKTYLLIAFALFITQLNAQNKNKLRKNEPRQQSIHLTKPIKAAQALNQFKSIYRLNNQNTFKAYRSTTDKQNGIHTRYQQYYKGLKVEFGTAITHGTSSVISMVNGELYDASNTNTTPTITKKQAFANAVHNINAESYLWENTAQAKLMKYKKPEGTLVLFPDVKTGLVHLAYKFDIYATKPISRQEIYIDAHTGKFLYTNPIIKHANQLISDNTVKKSQLKLESILTKKANSMLATGTAATRYSGSRNIETSSVGGNYVLQDNTRGNGIFTWNCQTTTNYQNVDFTDNDNTWTSGEHANAAKDDGALDAHWGAEMTYDFWQTIFGRNSFDDNGAAINSYVHFDTNYDNAFWDGSRMTYGDGNGFDILTAIDVCGHEIGHAICTYTANLAYQNQSGAMNEGFSDIWGACIEHFGRTGAITGTPSADVWKIGEDLAANPLRSMSNPLSRGNPDTYLGTNWTTTGDEGSCTPSGGNDQCGVHNNSGVLNHWFYILTVGKSGTNNAPSPDAYNVTGIGMTKSSEIAYLAERDYLTANSTYADARAATIAVAEALYCPASAEVEAVTNAWYAVNVGEQYIYVTDDVALSALAQNKSVDCASSFTPQITIVNGGTNSLTSVDITYDIDGGASITETWTGSLSICEQTNYTLQNFPNLSRGVHNLNVSLVLNNDGRPLNNTKSSIIFVNDAGTENAINPFTSNADALISYNDGDVTNSMWERGMPWSGAPGRTLTSATSGNSEVYATKLDGLHGNQTKTYLVSQCYDLSLLDNTFVKFDLAFDIEENWDLLYMEYSTDGGNLWSVLGSSTDTDWYNSSRMPNGTDCFNCVGAQWTGVAQDPSLHSGGGTNGTMHEYSYSLAAFDGTNGTGETNIMFRFVYHADDAYAEEGAIIDNFRIEGVVNNALATQSFEFKDLLVYPNPTHNLLTVQSTTTLNNAKVFVVDMRGRVITTNTTSLSPNKIEVNLSSLASGAYLLVIENGKNRSVKQIIKN